jgi:predicted ribonuclease YlaK
MTEEQQGPKIDYLIADNSAFVKWGEELQQIPLLIPASVYRGLNSKMKDLFDETPHWGLINDDDVHIKQADDLFVELIPTLPADKVYAVVSNNAIAKGKADAVGVLIYNFQPDHSQDWKGFIEVPVAQMEDLYNGDIELDIAVNDYVKCGEVVFRNDIDNGLVEVAEFEFDGNGQLRLKAGKGNGFTTTHDGRINPLDEYQAMAIDTLFNNKFSIITGRAGSGKSMLSIDYWLFKLQDDKIQHRVDKVYMIASPYPLRGAQEIGFLPGSATDKLLDSSAGGVLKGRLGGEQAVLDLLDSNQLELLSLSDIRGRDIGSGEERAIVYLTEAQNLTRDLMKTVIQRCGKNAILIVEGDKDSQKDVKGANGLETAIETFRGYQDFGYVELQNTHRSELAEIAERM